MRRVTPRGEAVRQTPDRTIWEIDDAPEEIEGLDVDGNPDPAYAAALGLLRAPFGRRSLALVCDVAVWLVLQLPLWIGALPLLLKTATGSISPYGLVNHPGFVIAVVCAAVTVFLTLVVSVVQLVLHGRGGKTIGKAITGIRTVNVRTLERPGIGWILWRYLLMCASNIVILLGPALMLVSPTFAPQQRGRGLHDKAARVWLIDVRRGLDPYDDKRMRVARKLVTAEPTPERAVLPSLATPLDPAVQPEYRPGNRASAGVVGIARPRMPDEAPVPASLPAPEPVPSPAPAPGPEPVPAPAVVPAPAPASQFGLRLDTGVTIPVTIPVLLGRNPDAAGHPGASPVALEDDSRSLSKTHLLVRPVDGGLEIVDCASTNGSGLIRGGTEYSVAADTPIMTIEGDTVRLGDRLAAVVRV